MEKEKIKSYVLELNDRCNEACSFCYSISYDSIKRYGRTGWRLYWDGWYNILKNISKNGGKVVDFSGGEPTMHPDFPQILKQAKQDFDLDTIVSTNGTTYNSNLTKTALLLYADCIALSIHGVGETHDKIKQRVGSYRSSIKSYDHYLVLQKKVKVNTVVCKENKDSLEELGVALDIEESEAQWKLSQAIFRESGQINRAEIEVSNPEFEQIRKSISAYFPKAYAAGRITFRENDSQRDKFTFVPYIIASSDGELHIPIGEQHRKLGISLLDKEYYSKLEMAIENLTSFPDVVNENHKKFYGKLI